jgi:DNA gyrase/topoisomerase IV subunit A
MENQEKISSFLREHAGWQNKISGFKGELARFSNDLGNVLLKITPRDVPANAEHFQNQFILQKEVLDILRHDLKQYENLLEANLEKPGRNSMNEIQELRELLASRMDDFQKIFNELEAEYAGFTREELVTS